MLLFHFSSKKQERTVISGADVLGEGVGIGPGLGLGLGKTFKVKFHKNCENTIFIPEEIHQASEDKQSI